MQFDPRQKIKGPQMRMSLISKTFSLLEKAMTRSVLAFATIALLAFGTASAQIYGAGKDGELFTVDPATGAGTLVGTLPSQVTEIEYDNATGRAFAQRPDGSFDGFEFDISNAMQIGVIIPNGGAHTGIEVVGSTWYATVIFSGGGSEPSDLHTLDPFTGTSTPVGPTGVGAIAGIAYDEATSTMYGIRGGPGPADFLTINLSTGAATVIGSTGIQAGSLVVGNDGLIYAGGTGGSTDQIHRIDPATGAATLVGTTGLGVNVTGLTRVGPRGLPPPRPSPLPVPALGPVGLLLLGVLMAGLAVVTRRRGKTGGTSI